MNFELKTILKIFKRFYHDDTVAGWEKVLEVEEGDAAHIDRDGEYQEGGVDHS